MWELISESEFGETAGAHHGFRRGGRHVIAQRGKIGLVKGRWCDQRGAYLGAIAYNLVDIDWSLVRPAQGG